MKSKIYLALFIVIAGISTIFLQVQIKKVSAFIDTSSALAATYGSFTYGCPASNPTCVTVPYDIGMNESSATEVPMSVCMKPIPSPNGQTTNPPPACPSSAKCYQFNGPGYNLNTPGFNLDFNGSYITYINSTTGRYWFSGVHYSCAMPAPSASGVIPDGIKPGYVYAANSKLTPIDPVVKVSASGILTTQDHNRCPNLPLGWGCYYAQPSNNGELYFYPSFPTVGSTNPNVKPTEGQVSCEGSTDPTGTYYNVKWTASDPDVIWGGPVSGTGQQRSSFIPPGTAVTASVSRIYNGGFISGTCSISVPPINSSCTAEAYTGNDPKTGIAANTLWTAHVTGQGGGKVVYKWNGALAGGTDTMIYKQLQPNVKATAQAIAYVYYGSGANKKVVTANSNAACSYIVSTAKTTCSAKRVNVGTLGDPNYKNVLFTASTKKGAVDLSNTSTYDWKITKLNDKGEPETTEYNADDKNINEFVSDGRILKAEVIAHTPADGDTEATTCQIASAQPVFAQCTGTQTDSDLVKWTVSANAQVGDTIVNLTPDKVQWDSQIHGIVADTEDSENDTINDNSVDGPIIVPSNKAPTWIENYYGLLDSEGTVDLENIAKISVVVPGVAPDSIDSTPNSVDTPDTSVPLSIPDLPLSLGKNKIVAAIYNAFNSLFAVAPKPKPTPDPKDKKVDKTIGCRVPYTPLSEGTIADKLVHAAEFAADVHHPYYTCSNVGCAVAVNGMVGMATGNPVDNSAATSELIGDLQKSTKFTLRDEMPEKPTKAIKGKTLGQLTAEWVAQGLSVINAAKPGDIIISPTVGANVGHVGIMGNNGKIISNNSASGRVGDYFTPQKWYEYYVIKKNLRTYIFSPK